MRTKQTWFRKKYRHQDICIHRICIYRIYKISGYASSKLSTDTTAVSKTDFFSVKPVGGQSNGTNKTKNKLYKVHMTNCSVVAGLLLGGLLRLQVLLLVLLKNFLHLI